MLNIPLIDRSIYFIDVSHVVENENEMAQVSKAFWSNKVKEKLTFIGTYRKSPKIYVFKIYLVLFYGSRINLRHLPHNRQVLIPLIVIHVA